MSNGVKPPYTNNCTMGSCPESRTKLPALVNPTPFPNLNPLILIIGNATPKWPGILQNAPKPECSNDKGKGTNTTNTTTPNSNKNKNNNNNNKNNSSNSSTSNTTRNINSSNANQKKLNSNLSSKLRKDSKLTQQEHQCHFNQNLCLFCGKGGHAVKDCSKVMSSTAKGRSATITDKTSEAKSSLESKNL